MENNLTREFLEINHLEKIYPNGEKAVYDFSLSVKKNEFIVIVGPSGCGKSTTLRMIAGLEDVSEGELYLDDELINYKPTKDRKMAIVFQSYALYPQMNVYENIAFPLKINKYKLPIVHENLKSVEEINKLIGENYEQLLKVMIERLNKKGMHITPEEHISSRLNVSINSSMLLIKFFDKLKYKTYEELFNNKKTIEKDLVSYLSSIKEKEETEIKEKNILLNTNFEEIDEFGEVKKTYRKLDKYEIRKKVFAAAKILDLGLYLDKLPKELSGGQMQRVALGRAIVKEVPLFLMDEPLSNLDAKLRLVMRSEIVKLHNNIKATTIYVTHDQTEAMTMASRIVVMSRGFIQQIGTPDEVYSNPKNLFVAKFIGSPTINTFNVSYSSNGTLDFGENIITKVDDSFISKHYNFYHGIDEEFENIISNFDKENDEKLLKMLSALGGIGKTGSSNKKKNIFTKIKDLFKKKNVEGKDYSKDLVIGEQKHSEIKNVLSGEKHNLIVAIRPEYLKIALSNKDEKVKENEVLVEVTVSELLGAEYNVHFDFMDSDVVCKFPRTTPIKVGDTLKLRLDLENAMVFDPITGSRII